LSFLRAEALRKLLSDLYGQLDLPPIFFASSES
jgi:hypothetical protein